MVRAIEQMKLGSLDMIVVIFKTEERSSFMEFSVPYATGPTSVFVPRGRTFPFNGVEDLKGHWGLMMRGDSISDEFTDFENQLNITQVATYLLIFHILKIGRADYTVAARDGILVQVRKLGQEDSVEVLSHQISERNLHIAISKKSTHLRILPHINRSLEQLEQNGQIKAMIASAIDQAARQ